MLLTFQGMEPVPKAQQRKHSEKIEQDVFTAIQKHKGMRLKFPSRPSKVGLQRCWDSQFSNWEPSSAYTNSLLTPSIGMTLCASFRDTLLRCEPPIRRCKTFQSRCWWMAVKISFYCNILLSSILGLSWVFFYCSFLKYLSLTLTFLMML